MGKKVNFSATVDLTMAGVELDGQVVRESYGNADSSPAIKLGSEFIVPNASGTISKPIPPGSKFKIVGIGGFKTGGAGGAGDSIVVNNGANAVISIDTSAAAQGQPLESIGTYDPTGLAAAPVTSLVVYDPTHAVLDGDAGDVLNVVATKAAGNVQADLVVELLRVL